MFAMSTSRLLKHAHGPVTARAHADADAYPAPSRWPVDPPVS